MDNHARNHSFYFDWVQRICAEKNIRINGKITQVRDDKLYCIPTDVGDLYLKKATSFIVDELFFTHRLMELGIISLPEWIGYDHNMKLYLMRDMGGADLSSIPLLDMETLLTLFISLSRIQKASIEYIKSACLCGFDYRIDTMLEEAKTLPESAYKMLSDTRYRITQEEMEKLKRNIECVKTLLESINTMHLPDTIHHGDLGAYNVRIVNGKCIFYDWGCGGVSHPFFDAVRLLSSSRDKMPTDVQAKEMIVDAYLQEWTEYANKEELSNIFTAIDGLARFYMAYVKYIRAWNLHQSYAEKSNSITADGLGLERRYETASIYLKRFIGDQFA